MSDWATQARAALAEGPTALVTVLATEGSAPRGSGARMVVTAEAQGGTIGGGALEYRVSEQARAILEHPPGSWRVQDYPLGPLLGQCCGGRVRVLVERLDPAEAGWIDAAERGEAVLARLAEVQVERRSSAREALASIPARGPLPGLGTTFLEPIETPGPPLLLFGAGHVGRAIAERMPGLPLRLAWFDSRAEEADHPGVLLAEEAAMVECARTASTETAILIVTHDHALDYRLIAAALSGDARFIGLIGSATKRSRFLSRLEADGLDPAARARLTCPIGLPGLIGKEPGVIAIAALAQLLLLGRQAA